MTITVLRMAGQLASTIRIGTAERERAAADLGEHLSAGRLSTEEFDERVQQTYAARTAAELAPLFRDLPELRPAPSKRRVDMKMSKPASPVENFTIAYDKSGNGCTLREEWDTTRATVDISAK